MAPTFNIGFIILITIQLATNGTCLTQGSTETNNITVFPDFPSNALDFSTVHSEMMEETTSMTSNNSLRLQIFSGRKASRYTDGLLSEKQFFAAKRYMMLFFLPIIILFGILGNLLSIICLLRLPLQDSISVYLCALSMADTVALVCYFVGWLPVLMTETDQVASEFVETHTFIPVKNFLRLAAKHTSSYLVVIISIERLLAVCRPLSIRQNVLVRYPKIIAGCILVIVSSFFLVNMWRYEVHSFLETETNATRYEVTRSQAAVEGEFFNVYGLVAQIIFTFASTCIVLFCTVVIVIVLFKQTRIRQKLTRQQTTSSQNEMRRVTWMLVTLAIIYATSALPTCIIGIMSKFSNDIKLFSKEHFLVYLMYIVGDFLSAIKSSVNFLIYVFFSSRFRGDFLKLITCSKNTKSDKAVTMAYRLSEYTKE